MEHDQPTRARPNAEPKDPAVNQGRHAAECKICTHPQRDEIEKDFLNWQSPASIAKQYGLRNRSSVYRHAHAMGPLVKRQRNVRAALEKIIERAGEVEAQRRMLWQLSRHTPRLTLPVGG